MQSFTVTTWAILALVFVAGWFLGLASHSGGRKWRERYAAEREAHAAEREAHATARKDVEARVAASDARYAELEREHARLRAAAPVTAQTVAPRPVVASAARPAYPVGERRGWFDWGPRRN